MTVGVDVYLPLREVIRFHSRDEYKDSHESTHDHASWFEGCAGAYTTRAFHRIPELSLEHSLKVWMIHAGRRPLNWHSSSHLVDSLL
jgi:hypothetical protein